jgi:hypothetical protein
VHDPKNLNLAISKKGFESSIKKLEISNVQYITSTDYTERKIKLLESCTNLELNMQEIFFLTLMKCNRERGPRFDYHN